MKNPFEKGSRVEEYNNTEEKAKELEEKKDKLDFPLGHNDKPGFLNFKEVSNAILSVPNIPASKIKEIQIALAKKKLEGIYDKDEKEAYKLNEKYDALVEEVKTSGDSTKLKEFAVNELGVDMGQ